MATQLRNIVVFGKSDLSAAILHALSHASEKPYTGDDCDSSPPYILTLLIRHHQSAPIIPSVYCKEVDWTSEELTTAFQYARADVVISTVAPTDVQLQKILIEAAIATHVRHFIPCEFSYDTCNVDVGKVYSPAKARAEVLEYLKQKEEIQWTAIATGCLLGGFKGLFGLDTLWKTATIYGTGEESFPCSTLPWIGKVVLQVLEDLQKERGGKHGRYIYRPELVTRQNELLAVVEKFDGNKWEVMRAHVSECKVEAEKRMEKGFLDGAMMLKEREVLFGEVGDLDVWEQVDENSLERGRKLEGVVRLVTEKMKGDDGADCGC